MGEPAPRLRHGIRAMCGATGCRISAMSASSGLIAMKLDEGDRLIGVATCREGDDVLLATRTGPLHPLPAVR